jgi:hypothetical protein
MRGSVRITHPITFPPLHRHHPIFFGLLNRSDVIMLRWVMLSVVVVVLAATATLVVQYGTGSNPDWSLPAGSTREGPQPRVEVEGPLTHEFGAMSTQKVATHKWTVKNLGEGDLEIFLAGSDCQCTVAKLQQEGSKETVKPGGSTRIEVEWKTKDAVGEFAKNVSIGTNDANRPEFKLNVHGTVQNPVVVLPPPHEGVISLGNIANDEPTKASFAVFSPDRERLKLTKVSTSRPELIVPNVTPLSPKESEQLKTKGGYRLNLDIKPGMPLGVVREELIIETDHPDQPKLQYTLVGSAAGPISFMPSILRIVAVNSKDVVSGKVTLLVRAGRPTSFTVARKSKMIEVAIASNDTPTLKGRYLMTVTVQPGTPSGVIDDEIILQTDHPKAKEVRIPVNIVVGSG